METLTRPADDLTSHDESSARASSSSLRGVLACLASAAAFGVAPVFGREVDALGVSVTTMLAFRFGLAAIVFWTVALRRSARIPRGRALFTCIAMGGLGYAVQSSLFFTALTYVDATLVALLLYLYPTLVVVLAVGLRRESADLRMVVALITSLGGLALLLGGGTAAGSGAVLGVLLGIGAAFVYALYITLAQGVLATTDVFAALAVITTSASTSLFVFGAASGRLTVPSAAALGWIGLLALVSTVVAGGLFLIGVGSLGASRASILSCVEPVITAVVAVALYAEVLTPSRVAGGAAVLAAVVVLETRGVRGPSRPLPGVRAWQRSRVRA